MRRRFFVFLAAFLLLTAAGVRAEKVDMSVRQLRKTATHIVTGRVTAIQERTEAVGEWRYQRYVALVRVDDREKGSRIKERETIKVRYWTRNWTGKGIGPLDTHGHRGLPRTGERLRVYLARNAYDGFTQDNHDGGYNVVGANGFEQIKFRSRR